MSIKQRSLGTMSSAARGILITGGTNATPIVATITAAHRLKNGDRIAIAGVTTLTSMNGEFSVDTVAATTLNLTGSVGNGAFGGTAVVAVLCDRTPFNARHSAIAMINQPSGAVLVGTIVFEYADSVEVRRSSTTRPRAWRRRASTAPCSRVKSRSLRQPPARWRAWKSPSRAT
jgi:hypothetical protein